MNKTGIEVTAYIYDEKNGYNTFKQVDVADLKPGMSVREIGSLLEITGETIDDGEDYMICTENGYYSPLLIDSKQGEDKYNDPFKNIWEIECHYDNGEWYEDNDSYDYVEHVYGTIDDVRQYIKNKIKYGIGEYKECTDRHVEYEPQMGYFMNNIRTYDDGEQYSVDSWSFYSETAEDDHCILNRKYAEHEYNGCVSSYAWATWKYKAHMTTLDDIIITL